MSDLRQHAATDPLTGVGHAHAFAAALDAARRRGQVAVIAVAVDGFGTLNDEAGRQAGDRVLRTLAAALSGVLRTGDQLFRAGGDEFAALVSVTEEGEAQDAARRLQQAAATTGRLTVSVGVALVGTSEPGEVALARAAEARR